MDVSESVLAGNTPDMDQQQPPASVDETLLTSVERVRSSRQLIDQIEERLARGAELLDPTPPVIDLRDDEGQDQA